MAQTWEILGSRRHGQMGQDGSGPAERGFPGELQAIGLPERSEGARNGPSRSAGSPISAVKAPPDAEVPERPTRRLFTFAYKLGVLRAADAATKPGKIAALLRREGLLSVHLVTWC